MRKYIAGYYMVLVADDKVHNQLFSNKLSKKVIQEVVLSKVAI